MQRDFSEIAGGVGGAGELKLQWGRKTAERGVCQISASGWDDPVRIEQTPVQATFNRRFGELRP